MSIKFNLNQALDIPIYQQLVDIIKIAVRKGELAPGEKLPTVQEMTESLGIARGTVKRAYDELERAGIVDKAQGRGTFICYRSDNQGSRKEQAMAAIDGLFSQLEDMGFGAHEINIFLNLKLRELEEEEAHVKVAVVECNPENLSYMSEQLRHIPGVDLYSYLLDSIQQYPYKLNDDFDLVVVTSSHSHYIESILPPERKIVRVALRPSSHFLASIIRLGEGKRIGIVSYSKRFGSLIKSTCESYAENVVINQPLVITADSDISGYLANTDVLIVPKAYERHFGDSVQKEISKFSGELVDCSYKMDEGSLLYLETKINRLLAEKKL